ncbi:trypsin-like peptidase domain-containing protein [Gallintestinimicrobium sp.]|uniref:S1C family serine protease n=1 Tax=Gallintestinimicrobium sp. TaxID=2981655 RepID=UPI003076EFEF
MGYGYDPEETTGQEHMDGTAPESGGQEHMDGTAPESGGQEYTDSAQKTDASDMSAYSGVSDDTSAYSSGSTGAADNAQNASDNTQDTFNSASDADQGAQPSRSRYEYQNYYNDRYRGDDSKQKYGYQPGVQQTPAPKKRDSAGKWIAVSALVVIFVCVCIGIGLIGVYSIRSANQLDSASVGVLEVAPDAGDDAKNQEDDGNHAATDSPERSEAGRSGDSSLTEDTTTGDGQVAVASEIAQQQSASAVVTDVTQVVEAVMPACVSITNNFTQTVQDFWGQTYSQDETASGSGIIIGENEQELLIVTNNHVVDSTEQLYVQFIDGETVEAQVKGTDASADLAVVAVKLDTIANSTKQEICIARMGDSDSLKIGEPAIAIGNALGYGQSVTTGVISALNRKIENSNSEEGTSLIQTDAAINPGNSGGALLNMRGEVIGINSNKIGGSSIEGMGYAIPISTARPIIEDLMERQTRTKYSEEERGYLGISCINVTSDLSENFSMPQGIFVAQVYSGTGAEAAGLVRGNIVVAFDGVTVQNQEELTKQMQYYKAGESVEITIMVNSANGYQQKNVTVTLSSYDQINAASKAAQESKQR